MRGLTFSFRVVNLEAGISVVKIKFLILEPHCYYQLFLQKKCYLNGSINCIENHLCLVCNYGFNGFTQYNRVIIPPKLDQG